LRAYTQKSPENRSDLKKNLPNIIFCLDKNAKLRRMQMWHVLRCQTSGQA
jgi:hypothetical protein